MNRDQVKGTAKDIAGKVQRKVGQVTGSTDKQIKGGVSVWARHLARCALSVQSRRRHPAVRQQFADATRGLSG